MINATPIEQTALIVAGLVIMFVGIVILSRSGKQSQNYSETARISFNVVAGTVIIVLGLGFAAFSTGPGQAVLNWFTGIFS